jgi:hypothetical protein
MNVDGHLIPHPFQTRFTSQDKGWFYIGNVVVNTIQYRCVKKRDIHLNDDYFDSTTYQNNYRSHKLQKNSREQVGVTLNLTIKKTAKSITVPVGDY